MENKFVLGAIQNDVSDNKTENINRVRELINTAADKGAQVIVLPEMFNCPYDNAYFPHFAEEFPAGPTISMLSETAAGRGIYIFGGSIPEREQGMIFNTCFVFGPNGLLLAKHRKAHLFDVELSEGISFKESSMLSRGNEITVVDTAFGKIGIAICYDIRFPEMARAATLRGAVALLVPAAFNLVTGPAHWELTMRMRAVDNQFYVAGVSPARNEAGPYIVYGHSILVDPWGKVLDQLDEKQGIIIAEIDLGRLQQVRDEFPLLKHRRTDIYEVQY